MDSRLSTSFSLTAIEQARRSVLEHGLSADLKGIKPWLAASWQRCLRAGLPVHRPTQFEPIAKSAQDTALETNEAFLLAARPRVAQLAGLAAGLGYFALLTDYQGVVIDVAGRVDHHDPDAAAIARVGVNLSETIIGTSAISSALIERHPVALHQREHFLDAASVFTCAGAPVFDPLGRCVGMLDLTGIRVREHPHLVSLVAQMAQQITQGWLATTPHELCLLLGWPALDRTEPAIGFGHIWIDKGGFLCGADAGARQTLPELAAMQTRSSPYHLTELFARPAPDIQQLSKKIGQSILAPLWSGLEVQLSGVSGTSVPAQMGDVKVALIKQAVVSARGNVNEAAHRLGISRATIYRVLGKRR
jgi:sigma-54 dependent transcriptional regulator, acetoin dehydrogenase operon transcriptional activator AcoR